MVFINDPSSSFTLPVKYLLVSLFIPIQFFFPWMAGCHLIIWDVFHKTISSVFFSLLVFQQLRSTLLLKMPFQTLLWQKLAFSSPFFYFNHLSSISLSRRHCVDALFKTSSCPCHAYPFNRSVVPLCSSSFILSSLSSLFNRSAVRICSSLFLFSNEVFFNFIISAVFFSRNGLTFARFFGFTRLSKKQLSFTSSLSLPFSLWCHSRSRDEILS